VLVRGRDDLVVRGEAEPPQDDPAAVGRRRRQRDGLGSGAHERGKRRAQLFAPREGLLESGLARPAVLEVTLDAGLERLSDRPGERPERPRVQVCDGLQDGKQRPRLLEGHWPTSIFASTTG